VKKEFKTLDTKVNETGYDMDYALRTIKGLHECTTFSTISLLLEQSSKAADEIVKRGYTYSGTNKINTNKIDPSNPTNIPQIERTTSKNSLTPISPSSANKLDVLTSFNEELQINSGSGIIPNIIPKNFNSSSNSTSNSRGELKPKTF